MSIYDLTFKDTAGKQISMREYEGKTLLLVNTATQCGLAPQLEGLEQLHDKFKDKGLVVIGFPCDQFMGQEPETNDTLVAVCKKNFGVTFLLSEKIDVNGADTHPIFKLLKSKNTSVLGTKIKWNFTKFLVSSDGTVVKRYSPTTQPAKLRSDIEHMLVKQ